MGIKSSAAILKAVEVANQRGYVEICLEDAISVSMYYNFAIF